MLKRNFAKYSALVGAMAFEAWMLWDLSSNTFNWSAAIGFVTTLLTFIGSEYSIQREVSSICKEGDGSLFNEMMAVLPMRVIQFMRGHDFRGSYLSEELAPLLVYRQTWEDVLHVYNDRAIERRSRAFHKVASKFIDEVARRTHPIDPDFHSVYPHGDNYVEDPVAHNRIEDSIRILNSVADDVVARHTRLMEICRKRLPKASASSVVGTS